MEVQRLFWKWSLNDPKMNFLDLAPKIVSWLLGYLGDTKKHRVGCVMPRPLPVQPSPSPARPARPAPPWQLVFWGGVARNPHDLGIHKADVMRRCLFTTGIASKDVNHTRPLQKGHRTEWFEVVPIELVGWFDGRTKMEPNQTRLTKTLVAISIVKNGNIRCQSAWPLLNHLKVHYLYRPKPSRIFSSKWSKLKSISTGWPILSLSARFSHVLASCAHPWAWAISYGFRRPLWDSNRPHPATVFPNHFCATITICPEQFTPESSSNYFCKVHVLSKFRNRFCTWHMFITKQFRKKVVETLIPTDGLHKYQPIVNWHGTTSKHWWLKSELCMAHQNTCSHQHHIDSSLQPPKNGERHCEHGRAVLSGTRRLLVNFRFVRAIHMFVVMAKTWERGEDER